LSEVRDRTNIAEVMIATERRVGMIREYALENRLLHFAGPTAGGVERPELNAARETDDLPDGQNGEARHHTRLVADSAGAAHRNWHRETYRCLGDAAGKSAVASPRTYRACWSR
jgi:hypothetical protein